MSKVFVLFSGSRRCWRSIIFVCNWQVLNAVFDSFFSLSSSSFYYYYYNARLVSYFIVMLLFLLLFNLFKSALKWIKLDLTNKWRLVDSIRGRNLSCAFAGPDRRIPRCQLSVTRKPFQAKPLLPLFLFYSWTIVSVDLFPLRGGGRTQDDDNRMFLYNKRCKPRNIKRITGKNKEERRKLSSQGESIVNV